MAASWVDSVTPLAPPASSVPHSKDLVYAGLVTGAWSGLLSLLVYLLARVLGVPCEMFRPGSDTLAVVPWLMPLVVPIVAAVLGGLLASLALGRPHAQRIVFWAGTGLALASLASPLIQPAEVIWSSRIWLAVPHLITWFLVVPQIARIVGDSEPGSYAERE